MSFYKHTASATILATASLSAKLNLSAGKLVAIQMPAAWDAANLTFQASHDDVTYQNVYDSAGTEYTVTAAASRFIVIDQTKFLGINFLKVRSGTAGVPVAQSADRVLSLVGAKLFSA